MDFNFATIFQSSAHEPLDDRPQLCRAVERDYRFKWLSLGVAKAFQGAGYDKRNSSDADDGRARGCIEHKSCAKTNNRGQHPN